MAAHLAAAGFPTAPTMIDGEHGVFRSFFGRVPDELDTSLATLGHEFGVSEALTKRFRASGRNILPMKLMHELTERELLAADQVAHVDVTLPQVREVRDQSWEAGLSRPGATSNGRAGSLRFQVAIILTDGRINSARYETPIDTALATHLDKVRLRFEPRDNIQYARIDVTMTDGTRHTFEGDDPTHPPMDPLEWLLEGGEELLGHERIHQLADLIAKLESVGDIREVLAGLTPSRHTPA